MAAEMTCPWCGALLSAAAPAAALRCLHCGFAAAGAAPPRGPAGGRASDPPSPPRLPSSEYRPAGEAQSARQVPEVRDFEDFRGFRGKRVRVRVSRGARLWEAGAALGVALFFMMVGAIALYVLAHASRASRQPPPTVAEMPAQDPLRPHQEKDFPALELALEPDRPNSR